MVEMTQDELDAAIVEQARINKCNLGAVAMAHEALRLQREGWRPEPKPDPAMEKAREIWRNANQSWDIAGTAKSGTVAAAKVIADAIAQAVADARVKVPVEPAWLGGGRPTAMAGLLDEHPSIQAFAAHRNASIQSERERAKVLIEALRSIIIVADQDAGPFKGTSQDLAAKSVAKLAGGVLIALPNIRKALAEWEAGNGL